MVGKAAAHVLTLCAGGSSSSLPQSQLCIIADAPLLLSTRVVQGEAPPADELPPPYAWKLYFTALSAMPTHAHRYSDVLDRMKELGVAPQVCDFVLVLC